ncbi:T9SS type A sorting domain-containing protein [Hanstruepera marina]|uniref:T9SS type A sorting domain-containing protein n=1 Tax=Hanstruepera marina TaxID=2873265 RepID=UPI001CA6DA63|nr:T9SS type A sorting domain-containing protein [Hanstruepera marina]
MKNIFTFLIIILFNLTYAQSDLYVSNNSYVFVDGDGFSSDASGASVPLFVTNAINLDGTNAYIYLRDDAQLFQGNGVTGNSGTGRLSVYQTGNSNTYQYNYWGSPVGINSGPAGNSVFTPNINFYRETAAPITSTPFGFISGYDGTTTQIASYWLYTYIGLPATTNPYEDWIGLGGGSLPVGGDPSGTLAPGYGFTMKGNPSGAQQYDFRGRPNKGDISATINPNKETLVGNPYPSAIDSYYFIHDSHNQTNTTGVLKYWQQHPGSSSHNLADYVGGYALYTNAATNNNGTPADLTDDTVVDSFTPAVFYMYLLDGSIASGPPIANSMPKTAYRYIPIGQGFMMEGSGSASSVVFKNSHRVYYKQSDANSSFFRTDGAHANRTSETQYTDEGYNVVPEDFKRFRINVGFDNNGSGSYTRQLLMNFHRTATNGFDYGLEAQISELLNSDAHWTLEGTPYIIQAFNFNETLTIPLVVKVQNQQLVRFGIYDVQNFEESQPIYIHDIDNDVYVDLTVQAYELILDQGLYSDRFEITFTSESLSTDEITSNDFTIYQDNSNSQLTIINPKRLSINQVTLFDITGKHILNETNLPLKSNYKFSTQSLSDGVYITKIELKSSEEISKKVIVANKN